MSGKPQQKNGGANGQKRKADSQPQQPQKKAKEQGQPQQQQKKQQQSAPAAAAPKAAAPKAAAPKQAAKPQQGKAAAPKKAAVPEPEEEEAEDDGEEQGERDEEALAQIEKIAPQQEELTSQLESLDEQMNAEIYAIQKKFILKKRPILNKRDALFAATPKMWKTLLTEHETFVPQFEEIDLEILDHLVAVECEEKYSDKQIEEIMVYFTFSAGSKIVKAGKFRKTFAFNSEKETLECKATPLKEMPFVDAAFAKTESFFASWFSSEGDDDGILAAQDALSSELYVDPLQLYRHVAEGGSLSELMGDDEEGGPEMMFEESDEDEEAPQLV